MSFTMLLIAFFLGVAVGVVLCAIFRPEEGEEGQYIFVPNDSDVHIKVYPKRGDLNG